MTKALPPCFGRSILRTLRRLPSIPPVSWVAHPHEVPPTRSRDAPQARKSTSPSAVRAPQISVSPTSRNATRMTIFQATTVATGVSEVRFLGDNVPVSTARGGADCSRPDSSSPSTSSKEKAADSTRGMSKRSTTAWAPALSFQARASQNSSAGVSSSSSIVLEGRCSRTSCVDLDTRYQKITKLFDLPAEISNPNIMPGVERACSPDQNE